MSPLPIPTGDSEAFWVGCQRGELLLQQCADCCRFQFYPRIFCMACLLDHLEWVPARGRGWVYSFTTVHRAPTPEFQQQAPYIIVVVELEEGVRMISRLTDCVLDAVKVDLPVMVTFEAVSTNIALPYFRPDL